MPPIARPFHLSVLAPAKLNLALHVTGVREDGYHLLDSIIVPTSLYDRVGLTYRPSDSIRIRCRCRRPELPQDEANLAGKAARLFLSRIEMLGDVSIDIEKNIPDGGGLGGGSSDAAAVVRLLNAGLTSNIATRTLSQWSLDLGADVPFFVTGRPARVRGIGEHVSPVDMRVNGSIVIAFSGSRLSTAAVYQAFDGSLTTQRDLSSGSNFASGDEPFREMWVNDLEAAATRLLPSIIPLKARLMELGAERVLMTGSGAAVFGIWREVSTADSAVERLRSDDKIWAERVEIIHQTPEVERHR